MAQPDTNYGEQDQSPKDFIIWLDQHIGKSDECVLLKDSFVMVMNPTSGLYERSLNPDDIDRSTCLETSLIVQLCKVGFMFQAFDDIEKCYRTIERYHLTKRIFLITSGSKGKIIIPSLVSNFYETFVSGY